MPELKDFLNLALIIILKISLQTAEKYLKNWYYYYDDKKSQNYHYSQF